MLSRSFLLRLCRTTSCRQSPSLRHLTTSGVLRDSSLSPLKTDYEEKYADKLQRRAQEHGKTVADLRADLREQERQRRLQRLAEENVNSPEANSLSNPAPHQSPQPTPSASVGSRRKDSSPVKPLSSLLNLDKLLETPHTAEQISLLWRAYHESRSAGTGRGFLCATVPVDSYKKMLEIGAKYPTFVIPVPRENAQVEGDAKEPAYEFYLMEWGFHGPPPEPTTARNLFSPPKASSSPQTSTVLFTPLQEYKLRQSFATPYLVLTHYTDLVNTHGLVLLRGEITPSGTSSGVAAGEGDARYMLSQQDAQLLAIHLQRFYLWNDGSKDRAALLKTFHENPSDFKWEELLRHTDFAV